MSQPVEPTNQPRESTQPSIFDGQMLKHLAEAGLTWLRTNQQYVNSLNVFPVPDGDTGTNMVLTMQSAFDEIANSPESNIGKMSHALAHGALMGARGNSGVILSQILRGLARSLDAKPHITGRDLAHAFASARDTAYKGVVRPVEGTILTVMKDVATTTESQSSDSHTPVQVLEMAVHAADASVLRTPELLPVLREAGVVDSGGKGLFFILEGMLRYLYKQPLETPIASVQPLAAMQLENSMESVEPGQDYEIVVDFKPHQPLELTSFYQSLEALGTSIQIGEGDGMYRVHIHVPTEKRYDPIELTMSLGTVTKVAIENLMAQMDEIAQRSQSKLNLATVEPDQIAVITVAPGSGIGRVFASLGVAGIVEGGQTMNPSTNEILKSFENLPTDKVIILPNNKNIILAAQQAAGLTVKQVAVVPSRTVPQGLAAMMRLAPDGDFDMIVEEMTTALDDVQSGEITVATRTVEIDGVQVHEGEVIGLHNGKLVVSSNDLEKAILELLDKMNSANYELITLFSGQQISRNQANTIADIIREAYPDQEIELQEGGQPHYHFIIGVE